ncbi:acetyl-CoA acetyltransferase [Nocardioides panzhihuensis]|uniref:enoyl-CoA hydratase n=1 Tax=Nocardioides panzhihuensis TaxID=860243 RepID=A0A7Z0IQ39_9ACTN|nr:acetyl-CoA acetyltransferase [Nocardioides panzhihuensis]NYI75544.1 acetyl-CoA C-acetyltransferase [Nocardioides panzhihuensis]
MSTLPPDTPVLVGVGQAAERIDAPGYEALSGVGLAVKAARAALADTGVDASIVADVIDTVGGIRQFEISSPGAQAPLGRSDNYPRSVAGQIGAEPRRAILEVAGGQGPQHLLTELAGEIAAGRSEAALLFGSEAISTVRHHARAEEKPDFTEAVGGQLEDRGLGLKGVSSRHRAQHGMVDAPSTYAVLENARRARLGQSRSEYSASMGRLFEPFTRVAAKNPYAAAPVERSAEELVTVTERNRMIADPYPRFVVSRDQVNQGAAALVTSVATAERLGIPQEKWVFLHGHADAFEREIMERPDLGVSPSAVRAASAALEMAGIYAEDVACFDLYSCFPIAVSNVVEGLGLAHDDPRGFTVTGGLPFFGGAGNNYAMHAIAETVQRLRDDAGTFGFVGANGGSLSKYSVGVYSTTPVAWRSGRSAALQRELDAVPSVPVVEQADGPATIESFTVRHGKDSRAGIVIGRLDATGERFVAMGVDGDHAFLDLLATEQPVGQPVFVRSTGPGNRVSVSKERLEEILPIRPTAFRDDYESVLVRRDGHLLEITINRPEKRNSLTPPANDELDEVFDAYFADPDLWVAIITGAGERAFSTGNDLSYSASGKPRYMPKNGFGGLTHRADLPKPVIAAVNGFAMGGGFEIALACHLVVADEAAQFALTEVKVGLVAGAGGAVRLPRAIAPKLANELILTGRRMGADEAHRVGLVNRVAPAGGALPAARELAAEILESSPTSVRTSIALMAETSGISDVVDAVNRRSAAVDDLLMSEDSIEGITAFAQKRAPQWKNR